MDHLLLFTKNTAHDARHVMLEFFLADQMLSIKDDNTPVTIADTTINDIVMREVRKMYPDFGILAEEESDHNDEEYVWVCDPIDGTIPYNLTIPVSTFALSLVHNGTPIMGIIYDPFMDRMWAAAKGMGATLNDQPIHVNTQANLSDIVIASSGPIKSDLVDVPGYRHELQTRVFRMIQTSSSQFESALLAQGKIAGSIDAGTDPHDMAAVKIIVEEAGGRVTDLFGNDQRYDAKIQGSVVSNGIIHDELLEVVSRAKL